MAAKRARKAKDSAAEVPRVSDERLIANLLALHLVKDAPSAQQPAILTAAGFTVQDITRLLRMLPDTVRAAVRRDAHKQSRKKGKGAD